MSKKKIRVGFIGTGGIAGFHADILSEMEDVEIVAGCDIDPQALSKFAEAHEVEHTFEDYKELVQFDEVDAVSVWAMDHDGIVAAFNAGQSVTFCSAGHAETLIGYSAGTDIFTVYNPWGHAHDYTWAQLTTVGEPDGDTGVFIDWQHTT